LYLYKHGEVQRGPGAKRYESGVGEDINTKQGCICINMEENLLDSCLQTS